MNIDVEKLRDYLENYYGTAVFSGFQLAIIDLEKVRHASESELIRIAERERIDLLDFARE